jgi:hypothetical protein
MRTRERKKERPAVEIEGGLLFKLHRQHERVGQVEVHSQRPLQAVNIFHGKPVAEVVRTLPLLYHVCGVAQASAAAAACEQAMAVAPSEASRLAREMLVWMETAREHLWRILLDWTERLGEEKDKVAITSLQHYLPQLKTALFPGGDAFSPGARTAVNADAIRDLVGDLQQQLETQVFAMPLGQWLAMDTMEDLQHWLATTDSVAAKMLKQVAGMEQGEERQSSVACLPALDEGALHQCLTREDADDFVAQPLWQGKAYESTALCRQQQQPLVAALLHSEGNGVMTRMIARLAELAAIPAKLDELLQRLLSLPSLGTEVEAERPNVMGTGVGLAQVEAARGRLVHRLELEQGLVRRYQILAPTEWNFHPQGIAAELLRQLPARDEQELKRQADLLINAIDPCVRYQISVH